MKLISGAIAMLLLSFLLSLLLSLAACSEPDDNSSMRNLSLQYATVLPAPRPLATFVLSDQHGAPFTNADLLGHWTVVFSGFTSCPDICPLTLAQLNSAESSMTGQKHHKVIFITVDPQRDTTSNLKQYLAWFQPKWIGLTGTDEHLSALLASLGMAQVKVPAVAGDNYGIEHSTALVLLDPQGRMAGYWKAPLEPAELAADFSALPVP